MLAASPRGDQVPRQMPSWGIQIQSTSQAPANRAASLPPLCAASDLRTNGERRTRFVLTRSLSSLAAAGESR